MTLPEEIKADCLYFVGHVPCRPHKESGVHCVEQNRVCIHYQQVTTRILLIKLGAAGDVVRTTPLLCALRNKYPAAHLTWLTHFPDLVPRRTDSSVGADKVLLYDAAALSVIASSHYDVIINLDKDDYACSVVSSIRGATEMFGFTLVNNCPAPLNGAAEHKFMTGLFDDVNKANAKSYIEEIFEVCGFKFQHEEYILPQFDKSERVSPGSATEIVGLNTGCGGRWTSRLWPVEYWEALALRLMKNGNRVVLLGGPEEHEKNKSLAASSGADYYGVLPLTSFIGLMAECDVIVSAVTMAMHLAIGLKKQLILLNNIFNPKEFELYGRGEIVGPSTPCTCYFKPRCTNKEYRCIEHISVDAVYEAVARSLKSAESRLSPKESKGNT